MCSCTLVRDACAAEIDFNQLMTVDQTPPYYRIPHLCAGQPQHLKKQETTTEISQRMQLLSKGLFSREQR